ncbi:LysM peptidoglycan-binding domain-containing protein [Winogradskyella eckloniae]|uniref:LysM peptidoglycan-binding domain-containing protein n=1 Tax=Winogradskyella eckloniae TaxID=1089306 RepID=UPI001563B195|nr:LysM peptidoglycan-binding domain-containing protein [Winogradskyella eckloniae]NRD20585.1 LysM peptidoglycan-binding domain-containing protein [Winogradskyella eckloniae]
MKHFLSFLLIVFTMVLNAQNYTEHTVKSGETIESIAKQYLVTPFDIYALNPDAKKKFQPNTVLIIPNSKIKNEPIVENKRELLGYKSHKVKRKETLYGLTQKYNISEEELKKANRSLYSENLKKGDKIRIPQYRTIISKQTYSNTVKKYTVLPSEGKWRIAYKFGISVSELEALNPYMNDVIQPGDILNVPNIKDKEEKKIEAAFGYYEVLPKETFYSLKGKLNLTQEQLEQLNPDLKTSGLKAGMVLKVPAGATTESEAKTDVQITNLKRNLVNYKTKKIALMMPYQLHKIDVDSVEEAKDRIKNNRLLSIVLDFHVGALMALDSAKQLGISTDLKVFDTQYHSAVTSRILAENDFSDYDAVIGPMKEDCFDRVASALKGDRVPVIAAMNKPKQVYSNVFQTLPEKELLSKTMIDFVKADSLKTKVVIISDRANKATSEALQKEFPGAKLFFSRLNKKDKTKDAYFLYHTELEGVFTAGKTIVFLETDNDSFASSIISMLNGFINDRTEIVLATLDKGKGFEGKNIDNIYLSNLKFHYASVYKDFDDEKGNGFVKAYRKEYGITPSKYAARGFDITLDILMRLSSAEDLYEASPDTVETEYIENKFRYTTDFFGGYVNQAVYVVKFDDLRVVKAN